jgi:hypothetical protein
MYKLNPTEKWYKDAVAEEEKFLDDSIGAVTISGLKFLIISKF